MPTATSSSAANDQNRFLGSHDVEENVNENRWYRPRSLSPGYSHPVHNGVIHQSSSTTMGSWGFDVNRTTNGQTPSSSFISNNNNSTNNNNNSSSDHRTITRTPRRFDQSMEDYNERFADRSPPPPQRFKLRTPTLTRHRDGNDLAVVDRLVLGPSRVVQSDYYPSDESPRQQQQQQQQYMSSTARSRQSSTRSILRRRSKSIGDFTAPTTNTSPPPSSSPHLTQSYHQYQYHERPRASPNIQHRTQAEQELMAWQNRMLERLVLGREKERMTMIYDESLMIIELNENDLRVKFMF